jgi:3-phenylpropionate/trans-cinnamate dioxygenase ferredoxin reductase component
VEPSDEIRFLDGAPGDGAFVATYHRGDATTAVLAMNSPRLFTRLRRQRHHIRLIAHTSSER